MKNPAILSMLLLILLGSFVVGAVGPVHGDAVMNNASTGFVDFNTSFVDLPAFKFANITTPDTGGTEIAAFITALQREGFTVQEGKAREV